MSHDASATRKLDVAALLQSAPAGSHLYVCGPARLIDAVNEAARQQGLSHERVHHEAFALDTAHPGHPFVVKLAKQNKTVQVPANVSLLQALEDAGVSVPSGCRTGSCGTCVVRATAGKVLHHDSFLSPEQQAAGQMCPCVSRAQSDALTLDL